ncbi:MAG: pilin [Candidatus Altiarchaeota archaeon]
MKRTTSMKNKKRVFILLVSLLFILILISTFGSAQMVDSIVSPVSSVVCMIYRVIVRVAGAIAGLVFVIAGVKWVASQDDPGERKQAKETMKNAIIGLIIIMVANNVIQAVSTTFSTCGAAGAAAGPQTCNELCVANAAGYPSGTCAADGGAGAVATCNDLVPVNTFTYLASGDANCVSQGSDFCCCAEPP